MNELTNNNNEKLLQIILNDVKPSWKKMWIEIFKDENGIKVLEFLFKKLEKHGDTFYFLPKIDNILNTFKYFDIKDTKLVLLGQDPYINIETVNNEEISQAMGLSFSVPNGVKIPPSLKNIYKELKNCYEDFEIPNHGNLIKWVKNEKILLLNSALTVKKGKSNSHQKIWEPLTDNVINYISSECDYVVFLLLGNYAKSKKKLINQDKHSIICGVHPSPLSANRGFFGSNLFCNINNELEDNGKDQIVWNLS